MKILLVHNYYQQTGGEDAVVASEKALLSSRGNSVEIFSTSNDYIKGLYDKFKVAWNVAYSNKAYRKMCTKIQKVQPDIVHVHNFFPLLTPSIYDACQEKGVPVVQTLHNYRIICPGGLLMRDGHICEDCINRSPFRSVFYGCYRNSRVGSLPVAYMVFNHNRRKTWHNKVDCFIALTDFARNKFVKAGFPAEKIVVKPNCIHPDPGIGQSNGKYALFVGRFSTEKGIGTLIQAWQNMKGIPLKTVGDGPLFFKIKSFVAKHNLRQVELLGYCLKENIIALMKASKFLIFPSECHETFGLVAIEAFACGKPVIASHLGSMMEIIEDGRTGLHFMPGDSVDLASKVKWAWTHPKEMAEMGLEARREYEEKYTADRNYQILMRIYETAIRQYVKKVF